MKPHLSKIPNSQLRAMYLTAIRDQPSVDGCRRPIDQSTSLQPPASFSIHSSKVHWKEPRKTTKKVAQKNTKTARKKKEEKTISSSRQVPSEVYVTLSVYPYQTRRGKTNQNKPILTTYEIKTTTTEIPTKTRARNHGSERRPPRVTHSTSTCQTKTST